MPRATIRLLGSVLILSLLVVVGERGQLSPNPARIAAAENRAHKPAFAFPPSAPAFVENRGQWDERVMFSARRGGITAFFLRDSFVLQLAGQHSATGANIFLVFEGVCDRVAVGGTNRLPGYSNYLLGSDPTRWRTRVPSYASLRYRGLYPGVDVMVRSEEGRFEYDLLLAPGADLDQVILRCEGAHSLALDPSGTLVLDTAAGRLEQTRPRTYEIDTAGVLVPVACSMRQLDAERVGFEVVGRHPERSLVIDPGLIYSTYIGGSGKDLARGIAVDPSGSAVIAGWTQSTNFPTTPGAYDTSFNGGGPTEGDAFVTRLSPSGSVVYSTFLGGGADDLAYAGGINAAGEAFVAGRTLSSDFPTTPGAYDTTFSGDVSFGYGDGFVTRLSADGTSLTYSTFLGGGIDDSVRALSLDGSDAAFVTGWTSSSDFPITPGAYDTSYNPQGGGDAFVAKLSADGKNLVSSTFLGGGFADKGYGLAVSGNGSVLVTGVTASSDFPTTPGAYDRTYNGTGTGGFEDQGDCFVSRLNADLSTLVFSTFLGGKDEDWGTGIAVESSGAGVVTGATQSNDFPVTPGAFDTHFDFSDAFVSKLSPDGSVLEYSTFLGGTMGEFPTGLAVDASGAPIVVGTTSSPDFPTTPGAFDRQLVGNLDVFVTKLSADASRLAYSTFLGGSDGEYGFGLAFQGPSTAYITGTTGSTDFPTTPGAYDTSFNGGLGEYGDAFVAKLDLCATADASNYGSGWPGTFGIPSLTSDGPPTLCGHIAIVVGNSRSAPTAAVAVVGLASAHIPTAFGGTLLVLPSFTLPFTLPPAGASLPYQVVCGDEFCGLEIYLQVLEIDPGASKGVSFTAGLELLHGR